MNTTIESIKSNVKRATEIETEYYNLCHECARLMSTLSKEEQDSVKKDLERISNDTLNYGPLVNELIEFWIERYEECI